MAAPAQGRQTWRLLGLSVIIITLASLVGGRFVPIYDGVGFPDEPYRYVTPPADYQKTSPPSTAEDVATMSAGANPDYVDIASFEQGPQITLYFAPKSISVAPSVANLDIQAQPKAPTAADQPNNGTIAGNMYALITDHPATFNDKSHTSTINLRIPTADQSKGKSVIEFRVTGTTSWRELDTMQVGNDIYQAAVVGLGDYAMTTVKPSAASNKSTANTVKKTPQIQKNAISPLAIAMMVLVLLITSAIIAIRLLGRKHKQQLNTPDEHQPDTKRY